MKGILFISLSAILLLACKNDDEGLSSEVLLAGESAKVYNLVSATSKGDEFLYDDFVYTMEFTYQQDGSFTLLRDVNFAIGTWRISNDSIFIDVVSGFSSQREFLIKEINATGHSFEYEDSLGDLRVDNYELVKEK